MRAVACALCVLCFAFCALRLRLRLRFGWGGGREGREGGREEAAERAQRCRLLPQVGGGRAWRRRAAGGCAVAM